jgi:beta-mannosidase
MKKYDLAGEWLLSCDGEKPIPGKLPGSTYIDYIKNGMEDPFWGMNETVANELARHKYRYSRTFELSGDMLMNQHLELIADGLDTLCSISINNLPVGKTNNINRIWRLDVKEICVPGQNRIDMDFENPYEFIEAAQAKDPLPGPMIPIPGIGHLRKTPCHFGWDWGPKLPPAGIARSIGLESYDTRIKDLRIRQRHENGTVALLISMFTEFAASGEATGEVIFTNLDGKKETHTAVVTDNAMNFEITVENPQLWWCNGLGQQPLYHLEVALKVDGVEADHVSRKIGLRTIELDTQPDKYGHQFRFVINGVPIFAKGADWIPPDSFITRADRETMFFYIEAAKRANMNMLRVWGGGMYENEDFYDACDQNGILVWQDFIFACNPYPLYDNNFLDNVRAEVLDNVRRLRHRASLALWCGNNETEMFERIWKKGSKVRESNPIFYHGILRQWVEEFDGVTPYWPGSPSSGVLEKRAHNMKKGKTLGDTHLWQVWHGMRHIESFRDYHTRFCSEFGMESMPSMHTIKSFTDDPSPGLFDPVMRLHQKCSSGNEKMLYYLLAKYRNPARFEDFVYLSQLVQANTVRFATDCWRRNIGMQNGAIFWQMNDCWPVASWAGIDYGRQQKAVVYQACHFNKMLCLSNDYYDNRAEIYIVNEYPHDFQGRLEWTLKDFHGKLIKNNILDVLVPATSSKKAVVLHFSDICGNEDRKRVVLEVSLIHNDVIDDKKHWLLVPDKNAELPKAEVKVSCTDNTVLSKVDSNIHNVETGIATVTLSSEVYARYVYVEAEGVTEPWSDNFFDIPAGEGVTLTVKLPKDMDTETLLKKLKIKTLTDVEPKNSILKDKFLRAEMMGRKWNWLFWLFCRIFLG